MKRKHKKNYFYLFLIIILLLITLAFWEMFLAGFSPQKTIVSANDFNKYIAGQSFNAVKNNVMQKLTFLNRVGIYGEWPLSLKINNSRGNPFEQKN